MEHVLLWAFLCQSPRFCRFFCNFLAASAANKFEKRAVIQSAASAASAKGGCASSRLDHGLKFYVIRGGCASSRLISEFSDCASIDEISQSRVKLEANSLVQKYKKSICLDLDLNIRGNIKTSIGCLPPATMFESLSLSTLGHRTESKDFEYFWLLARPKVAKGSCDQVGR